jgi:hypothetical protein
MSTYTVCGITVGVLATLSLSVGDDVINCLKRGSSEKVDTKNQHLLDSTNEEDEGETRFVNS